MTNRKKILKVLKDFKNEMQKKYHVKKIGLFGSFLKGKQKKESDIDVLVDFKEDADFFDLVGLGLFLEEKLKQKVDIVPQKALRKELRKVIFKEVSFI